MAVDLHTHSSASDGSDPPARLVEKALRRSLTALALTDHDTQQGVEEARRAAGTALEVVPGTELSLGDRPGMHLLVLWLEPGEGPLQDELADLRRGRRERNNRIVETLAGLGMEITPEEVEEEGSGGSIGRPHIAAVLVRKGYAPDIRSAFDRWLGSGRPAYVERRRLDAGKALALARQSGAVPVLAHPHTLGIHRAEEMARLLGGLTEAGLVGLEAIYSTYRRHEREGYAHLARRFGLVPSGGSDYHGTYKPDIEVGVGHGDLYVPDSVLDGLREHAAAT